MFREHRYKGSLGEILTAQKVLENAPWLWAFNRLWAEGICCETGSIHTPDRRVFLQELEGMDDAMYEIFFWVIDDRIWQVKQVPKLMRLSDSKKPGVLIREEEPNPDAVSGNIADRIVAELNVHSDRIHEKSRRRDLVIPQVVIRGPGPVDRSSHYFIYQTVPLGVIGVGMAANSDVLPCLLESQSSLPTSI